MPISSQAIGARDLSAHFLVHCRGASLGVGHHTVVAAMASACSAKRRAEDDRRDIQPLAPTLMGMTPTVESRKPRVCAVVTPQHMTEPVAVAILLNTIRVRPVSSPPRRYPGRRPGADEAGSRRLQVMELYSIMPVTIQFTPKWQPRRVVSN